MRWISRVSTWCCAVVSILLLCLLPCLSASALAGQASFLGAGGGVYNVGESDAGGYGVIDYRPPLGLHGVGTWISMYGTDDGIAYFSGGILKDIYLSQSVVLTPSFGVGLYNQDSEDVVLGNPVEFRSAAKLSYELENGCRIGVRFGHVSNAGLGATNPGSEFLSLLYTFRLGSE